MKIKKMKIKTKMPKKVVKKSLTQWLRTWRRFWGKIGEERSSQQFVYLKLLALLSKLDRKQLVPQLKLVKQEFKKLEKIKLNISSQSQKHQVRIVSTETRKTMKDQCLHATEQRLWLILKWKVTKT